MPQAIKLTTEKTRNGIRYRKMRRGQVWISTTYPTDSRDNKRHAWNQYQEWLAEQEKPHPIVPALQKQAQTLQDFAQQTGDHEKAQKAAKLRDAIPAASPDEIMALAQLFQQQAGELALRETFVDLHRKSTNAELTAGQLADRYIGDVQIRRDSGRTTWGAADQVRIAVNQFAEWYGRENSMENFSEATVRNYHQELERRIAAGEIAQSTARQYQTHFRIFCASLAEDNPDEIPLPKNLRSRRLTIPAVRKEVVTLTREEIETLTRHATPRTELYLLLMLNCGMYQGDISDLTHSEVDLEKGRIVRARSKATSQTRNSKTEPVRVNWILWDRTLQLLKKLASKSGDRILTTAAGLPLVRPPAPGGSSRVDVVRSAWRRLVGTCKRKGDLPADWQKTLKQLRKTSSSTIEQGPADISLYYSLYLGHSIAKKHYLASGQVNEGFDRSIIWMGDQLGFPTDR